MTRRIMLAFPAGILLTLGLGGQEKKKEEPIRLSGRVKVIYKEKSSFDVTTGSPGVGIRTVFYTPETRFTFRNGPGKAEDLKEGLRVICLGKAAGDKYVAERIDLREK
jgi:hypothetical protein